MLPDNDRGSINLKNKENEMAKNIAGPIMLGDEVQCKITKFKGIVYGISTYLAGCRHIAVKTQTLDKDGKIQDAIWIDEPQLIVLKRAKIEAFSEDPIVRNKKPGGMLGDNEKV